MAVAGIPNDSVELLSSGTHLFDRSLARDYSDPSLSQPATVDFAPEPVGYYSPGIQQSSGPAMNYGLTTSIQTPAIADYHAAATTQQGSGVSSIGKGIASIGSALSIAGVLPGIGTALAGVGAITSGIANWYYASKAAEEEKKRQKRADRLQDAAIAEEQRRYEKSMQRQAQATSFQQKLLSSQDRRADEAQRWNKKMQKEQLDQQRIDRKEAQKQRQITQALAIMDNMTKFFNNPQARMQFANLGRR